jgi:hypothetical protein
MNAARGLHHGAFWREFDHHIFKIASAQIRLAQIEIKKGFNGARFAIYFKGLTGYELHFSSLAE